MGKKNGGAKGEAVVSVDALNQRLDKLQKWSKKAKKGSEQAKHRAARKRWRAIKATGLRRDCCGKPPAKQCKNCPRRAVDLIMRPLRSD